MEHNRLFVTGLPLVSGGGNSRSATVAQPWRRRGRGGGIIFTIDAKRREATEGKVYKKCAGRDDANHWQIFVTTNRNCSKRNCCCVNRRRGDLIISIPFSRPSYRRFVYRRRLAPQGRSNRAAENITRRFWLSNQLHTPCGCNEDSMNRAAQVERFLGLSLRKNIEKRRIFFSFTKIVKNIGLNIYKYQLFFIYSLSSNCH